MPKIGDRIEGIYASDSNPEKFGTFVEVIRRTGKLNNGTFYRVTDGKGAFWMYSKDSCIVHPAEPMVPLTDHREVYHDKALLRDALHHWGLPSQLAMVAEEAAELAVAAMHMLRDKHDNKSGATDAFCSEMADVEIMIDQMKVAGYADKIAEFKASKMLRLGTRLDAAICAAREGAK